MLQNIVAFSEYMNFNYVATLNENTAKKSYRITLEILRFLRRFSVLLSTVILAAGLLLCTQLPGRLFSPSDKCKKLAYHFLLHFSIVKGS